MRCLTRGEWFERIRHWHWITFSTEVDEAKVTHVTVLNEAMRPPFATRLCSGQVDLWFLR